MRWTWLIALLALSLGLLAPPGALAAGGPVPPSQGNSTGAAGVTFRYGAFNAGRETIVKRLSTDGSHTLAALRVNGRYGVPGVDYSGSTTGLSADGRTLVLAEVTRTGAPRTTRLLVLNTPRLAVRSRLALPGWSTVDAISPDGRWLYLLHYFSSDGTRYEVRAYDLLEHRLLTKPVVDPHDRGEAMTGFPVTRVVSAGGRWAYTLYVRPSGGPFVHALDTSGRRAVCIDLPSLLNSDVGNAHLRIASGGATLQIDAGGPTPTLIDTRTFAVTPAAAQAAPAPSQPASHGVSGSGDANSGGVPWALIALPVAALAVLGVAARRRTRPRVS
jgi:hypothetical protein